ncbi:hypothetical protein JD969_06030 [Planctomycetota bacterium]|nr:hypothetical protein JD969_06030 [Planctomycetota bacterium]
MGWKWTETARNGLEMVRNGRKMERFLRGMRDFARGLVGDCVLGGGMVVYVRKI